jgi:hypothetical protein
MLTPDLRVLRDLYGRMIFDHASLVDLEQQAGNDWNIKRAWGKGWGSKQWS